MNAAINFYNVAHYYIRTDKSHREGFYALRYTTNGPFQGRMSRFQHVMQNWGRRFDLKGCVCDQSTTNNIQQFADELNDANFDGMLDS